MSTPHVGRCTARHVIDQITADVVQMLLLVPEGARRHALIGVLEGFSDQCRECGVTVSEEDRILFTDVVITQFQAASATIAAGNDRRRAS